MRRSPLQLVVASLVLLVIAEPVTAHAGSLRLSGGETSIPMWIVIFTGGGVIAASFLLASLITDESTITAIHEWHRPLPLLEGIRVPAARIVSAASVVILALIIVAGLIGPHDPAANFAVVVVWAGWWAGYTMSIYLVGNTWPVVNPWRTVASWLPTRREEPNLDRFGPWPSVIGLLALVLVEVVSPVAESPRLLAAVIIAYSIITLAGTLVYGAGAWFTHVDPIARVFHCYGRVAPLQRTEDGIAFVPLTTELSSQGGRLDVTFVIALLWSTTFDGFVSTQLWNSLAGGLVGVGLPPVLVYLLAITIGFGVFLAGFRLASRLARKTAKTYRSAGALERHFIPSLLPIAAGYHLAHFLGYFLSLLPALLGVVTRPFGPAAGVPVLSLPGWFGGLELLFIILGHMLAIWIAHATSYQLFTGRLQPIRSQYPYIAIMVAYTMVSLWIVAQPSLTPPYV